MKMGMFIVTLLAIVCTAFAYIAPVQRPRLGSSFPTFPGHGPFNPKIQWPRLPRSVRY
ncbi:abaecin [Andrena cerasifolii]|uniref:abaecin n=1 Tax=Andrena cerasifolii TaxID=2819439 RepID=UPI0040383152